MTSRWAPGGVPEHREEVIIKKEEDDEGFGLGNVVGGSAGVQFDGSGSDRPKNGARRRRRAENEDQSVEVPDSVKEYLNATKDSAQEVVTRMTLLEKIVEKTGERVKVLEGENRELKARLEGSVVMSEMERAELEELRAFKRSVLGAAEIR